MGGWNSVLGMGVDKDDVWVVGYLGIPSSLKHQKPVFWTGRSI